TKMPRLGYGCTDIGQTLYKECVNADNSEPCDRGPCRVSRGRGAIPHPARRGHLVRALGHALVRGPRAPGHLRRALGSVDPLARFHRAGARSAMSAVGLFAIG